MVRMLRATTRMSNGGLVVEATTTCRHPALTRRVEAVLLCHGRSRARTVSDTLAARVSAEGMYAQKGSRTKVDAARVADGLKLGFPAQQ